MGIFFRGSPDITMCPEVDLASKVITRDFSWGKGGRCIWLTTYHPCSAETSRKSGALTTRNPLGHLGLLRETFTLFTRETEAKCLQNTLPYIPEGCDPSFRRLINLNSVIITCYTGADVKGSTSQHFTVRHDRRQPMSVTVFDTVSTAASGTTCGMSQTAFQVTRKTQTLSDLRNKKYHPEGPVQVKFCASRN